MTWQLAGTIHSDARRLPCGHEVGADERGCRRCEMQRLMPYEFPVSSEPPTWNPPVSQTVTKLVEVPFQDRSVDW